MIGCTHINTVDTVLDSSIDDYVEGLLDAREVTLYDAARKSRSALATILFDEEGSHLLDDCININDIRARALSPVSM